VCLQDQAKGALTSLDPSFAQRVKITGVTKPDEYSDLKLVVVCADDVELTESKTSLSRSVAIGLGILSAVCALAAIWIRILKSKITQKQKFESIFDNAGSPIVVFDGNLQIIDANQVAADMTGYSKGQLRNMTFAQINRGLPPETIKTLLIQTARSQDVSVFRSKVETRNNQKLDVEVRARNLNQSEDLNHATYIAVFPDITERKKQEDELKNARDEAIRANKAKSRFVASMSHELRTPLNGVIGMTQLLESTNLTATQADYLAACRASGETLLTVIGDILDFSKMEAGKLELEPQPTKLIPFIENIIQATSLQQKTPHVDLASFVDPRLSRSVMVDSDRLRQVIFNLIGNAAKFTPEGSIRVTAKCYHVSDEHADVQFTVSDTGIGIPKNRIDRLFEAFEQRDSSTTRKYGGTGLGLTICQQIVGLMVAKFASKARRGRAAISSWTSDFLSVRKRKQPMTALDSSLHLPTRVSPCWE
jgi:PAS domain S-box-containing protein